MSPPCLDALERSHRRHAEVVRGLVDAARQLAAGRARDDAEPLAEVARAVEYLHRSVPRHFADEERSLFPRLAQRRPEHRAALDQLIAEHPIHTQLHARIAEAAQGLTASSRPAAAKRLLEAAVELERVYEDHAAREDELFAVASTALSAADLEAIAQEMEARRDRGSGGASDGGAGRGGGGGGRGGGGAGGGRGGGGGGGGGRGRGGAGEESGRGGGGRG